MFAGVTGTGDAMTVQGTIDKTALLLVIAFTAAAASWVLGAALAGLVVGIATFIRPQ